jgi:hypothetical protein
MEADLQTTMEKWTPVNSGNKDTYNLFKLYDLTDLYKYGMTWNQALNILYDHPRVIKLYVKDLLREYNLMHLYFEGMHRQQAWRLINKNNPLKKE